jgi:hypothetical protein
MQAADPLMPEGYEFLYDEGEEHLVVVGPDGTQKATYQIRDGAWTTSGTSQIALRVLEAIVENEKGVEPTGDTSGPQTATQDIRVDQGNMDRDYAIQMAVQYALEEKVGEAISWALIAQAMV